MKKKVLIGLSGGVDSSVAAYLLKQQGYDVFAVTMITHQEENNTTTDKKEMQFQSLMISDAKKVAEKLDIPYDVVDFQEEFKKSVIDYFIDEYINARTPNPCIVCNRYIKWEALLKKAAEYDCDYIATGHYARVKQLENGRYTLCQSVTTKKDQTYALYNLTQEQLSKTLMPLGEYEKEDVREIAKNAGLLTANKPDSQEICFISNNDYAGYIKRMTGKSFQPGNFVDKTGQVLGMHKGIIHYTIGQRKGLGISLGEPAFVVEIRPETNEVVLGTNDDTFGFSLLADNINFMAIEHLEGEMIVTAKIRYSHRGEACRIRMKNSNEIICQFKEPVRAITPGQAVVFYQGSIVIGGAIIRKRL